MSTTIPHRHLTLVLAISAAFALSACGGADNPVPPAGVTTATAPADPGFVDTAPVNTSLAAFVDNVASNQRGDARYATDATNAGVRVIDPFLKVWQPLTAIVDAGVTAPAVAGFPAVVASTWTGLPNDGTPNGTVLNGALHTANIQYVVTATTARTPAQELAAYLDDRRGKGYSVTDGMGPLTAAWRSAAQQTTSITAIAADANTVLYNDSGNNTGLGSSGGNASFGSVVDLVNAMGNNGSTEPAKRFYKYARPFRWSSSVVVAPSLVPAISTTPATDGGYPSGHSAEAMRDVAAMAYVIPERFQEIYARALELGENRILAGMHSPMDVMGGRVQALAIAAANLNDPANATLKTTALAQAHTALIALTKTTANTFNAYAHSGTTATDRFADYATNKANVIRRLTFGFAQSGATDVAATVPKGAEALLETRLPYLSADQRREVLKTTALPSGYPVLDDAEGWGRLNMFAAGDGYGAFIGNVVVSMDASKGGFNALDTWRNDIGGAGRLTVKGSGTLVLGGRNSWTGGTDLESGTLQAATVVGLGSGDVYVNAGTLICQAPAPVVVGGKYGQQAGGTTQLYLSNAIQGGLLVTGAVTLGGNLHVSFQNGYQPKAGDTITVLTGATVSGTYATITVDGFKATATYAGNRVQLVLGS
jgi:autotransporter-associated beta strand protein